MVRQVLLRARARVLCPVDPLVVRQVLHPAQVQVPHLVPLPVVLRAEAHLRLRVGRPVQHLVLLRVEARVEVHHHHQVILPVILPPPPFYIGDRKIK